MGTGRSFGVILDAEDRPTAVPHAFQRAVVEVDVRRLEIARQFIETDGEAVVLRGNFYTLVSLIEDGLIRPPVSKFQLESLSAKGQAKQLMSQTDAEDRLFAG